MESGATNTKSRGILSRPWGALASFWLPAIAIVVTGSSGFSSSGSTSSNARNVVAPQSDIYPGVLTPFLSISMAFSNLFDRVSCFLGSVIQRQYSLRRV
jgi:hypothetical protein